MALKAKTIVNLQPKGSLKAITDCHSQAWFIAEPIVSKYKLQIKHNSK